MEVQYWPQADDVLTQLEEQGEHALLDSVNDLLARLAEDPGDRSLHTVVWQLPTYGNTRSTSVPDSPGWVVIWWMVGVGVLEVIYLGPREAGL